MLALLTIAALVEIGILVAEIGTRLRLFARPWTPRR
jgi:hypothetical protein